MDIIEVFSLFSISISDISNSSSGISSETEVDPTPFSLVFFVINHLIIINSIVTDVESHVISREDEFVVIV